MAVVRAIPPSSLRTGAGSESGGNGCLAGTLIKGAATVKGVAPLALKADGSELKQLGVATAVQLRQNVLAQFQTTLSDSIYSVPFGDAAGDIQITFLANATCTQDGSLTSIMQWYKDKRFRPKASKILTITVGATSFRGFLIGVVVNAQASNQVLINGTLIFKAWLP